MFDDMMHRGLWFAPTWLNDANLDWVVLSGIDRDIKLIDEGMDMAWTDFDLLSTRRKILTLRLERLRGEEPNGLASQRMCAGL
jgi:hypothetical protein